MTATTHLSCHHLGKDSEGKPVGNYIVANFETAPFDGLKVVLKLHGRDYTFQASELYDAIAGVTLHTRRGNR
jgi:hypothetical protein